MTRGKMVLITDDRVLSSMEFNGDMYIENGRGYDVIETLRRIGTVREYWDYVVRFNARYFGYPGMEYVETEIKAGKEIEGNPLLDFTEDYIGKWGSDYLYIKNIGSRDVKIEYKDYVVTVHPGGIAAACFGSFGGECKDYSEGVTAVKREAKP